MGRFLTADCFGCGQAFISLTNCEVEGCTNGFCDICLDLQKRCKGCDRIICEEHIEDGYCPDCREEELTPQAIEHRKDLEQYCEDNKN